MHGHILVVDDDIDTAVLACEGLRKRGFNARAVSSAEECLGCGFRKF
jgi:CheY-like chemotaxis protein